MTIENDKTMHIELEIDLETIVSLLGLPLLPEKYLHYIHFMIFAKGWEIHQTYHMNGVSIPHMTFLFESSPDEKARQEYVKTICSYANGQLDEKTNNIYLSTKKSPAEIADIIEKATSSFENQHALIYPHLRYINIPSEIVFSFLSEKKDIGIRIFK